jgi:hypothetical protein
MSRYIHIADDKNRDAEIIYNGKTKKPYIKLLTKEGKEVHTLRVLKGTAGNSYEGLVKNYKTLEKVAEALLKSDPEIDLYMTGRFIKGSSRVFVDEDLAPVSRISKKEIVFNPEGKIIEERIPKELKPLKLFLKKDIYNKFVFAKKYQLQHINGLTFDFLYEIAKELHDNNSLLMIGAGAKGNEPLVFQDGGKSYRAFLEGRVKDKSYILLLHLSNLELKGISI